MTPAATTDASTRVLSLGEDLEFGRELLTRRTAVVGQSDTGKTSTAVVIVEEARAAGAQVVVIDPSGAWWGVTSSADGQSEGLDMIVLGGEHGDRPLAENAGRAMARIVAQRGWSVVLDLDRPHFRSWSARVRFVADFLSELYEVVQGHILVVVDECHRFAPQNVRDEGGEAARCLGAVVDVAALARRRGLAMVAITQRLAKLHKDVLELCEVFIAHRLRGNNDRKAAQGWLENAGEDVKAVMSTIARLDRGVAHVSAPTLGVEGVYTIRPKSTFDSSRTIEPGEDVKAPATRTAVDLDELTALMAETIEQVEAEDPGKLRERIGQLEGRLREVLADPAAAGADDRELREQHDALQYARQKATERADAAETRTRQLEEELVVTRDVLSEAQARGDAADDAIELVASLRRALTALLGDVKIAQTAASGSGYPGDEHVLGLIHAHAPAGGAPTLAPVEALRADYLERTAQRLVDKISGLSDDEREALLFLIGRQAFTTINAVSKALSGHDGGGQRNRWSGVLKSLEAIGLVAVGGSGRTSRRENVEEWVRSELGPHSPTDDEVTTVRDRALSVLHGRRACLTTNHESSPTRAPEIGGG